MDAIIHIAEVPPELLAEADDPDNYAIDYQTRCTYKLTHGSIGGRCETFHLC